MTPQEALDRYAAWAKQHREGPRSGPGLEASLRVALNHVGQQKKPPAALRVWLEEALRSVVETAGRP